MLHQKINHQTDERHWKEKLLKKQVVMALAAACAVAAQGVVYWVDPAAAKGGDGSVERPFAGPHEVLEGLRAKRAAGELKGQQTEVLFKSGNYKLDKTITFKSEDSGSDWAPVVWRSLEKHGARFLCGDVVANERFKPVEDEAALKRLPESARGKVLVADVSAEVGELKPWPKHIKNRNYPAPHIFINGKFGTLARWPNEKDGYAMFSKPWGYGFQELQHRGHRWNIDEGVWISGYFAWDWWYETVKVRRFEAKPHVIHFDAKPVYSVRKETPWGFKKRRYCAINVFEELDDPGEWYLDRTKKLLYVYPPEGIAREKLEIVIATKGAHMCVKPGDKLNHFVLDGFSFETTAWDSSRFGGDNIRLFDCRFKNIAKTGLILWGDSNIVRNCEFSGIGLAAIEIGGGSRKTLTPANSVVEGCDIHDFGRFQKCYAAGVNMKGCGITVRGNTIYDAPHSAIFYNANDCVIEYNNIHDVLKETEDAGAVYTGRDWTTQGNVLRYNYVHDLGSIPEMKKHMIGFYYDDCDCGDAAYGNVFENLGRAFLIGGGRDHPVQSNLFVNCTQGISLGRRGVTWKHLWNVPGKAGWDLEAKAERIGYKEEPWKSRYPRLAKIMEESPREPFYNPMTHNTFVDCEKALLYLGDKMYEISDHLEIHDNVMLNTKGTNEVVCALPVESARGTNDLDRAFEKEWAQKGFIKIKNGTPEAPLDLKAEMGEEMFEFFQRVKRGEPEPAPFTGAVKKEWQHDPSTIGEFRLRKGLGNAIEKMQAGEEVKVAYFGGSITVQPGGWRDKTTWWLGKTFPKAKIVEINAALSGTGAGFGATRFKAHVLKKGIPDLLFVEFRVNGGKPHEMESIVRQMLEANPNADICFVYTLTEKMLPSFREGKQTWTGTGFEQVANKYGITSIDFAPEVMRQLDAGKIVFTHRGKEQEVDGRKVFSRDGIHPTLQGHGLYLGTIANAFKMMMK